MAYVVLAVWLLASEFRNICQDDVCVFWDFASLPQSAANGAPRSTSDMEVKSHVTACMQAAYLLLVPVWAVANHQIMIYRLPATIRVNS